ncbi:MAG: penicillin-binding protein 2 [Rhodospirillaceae bacterium]|jgi:cell division protein FtsI (penicillin-binding protein 3)|nr:penicillin-binding protein 2 [Rhodospirillaceae bacterium]
MRVWPRQKGNVEFVYPGADLHATPKKRVKLVGETQSTVNVGRARLMILAALFTFAFISISVRLVDLMILNGALETGPIYASNQNETALQFRADIVDRNGRTIATTLPTVNLYADAAEVIYPEEAATELLSIFPELDPKDLKRRLGSQQRFIYLRRHLTPTEQVTVNALGIPGLYFEESQRRIYPYGSLFAHVLGSTDTENTGSAGVELTFNKALSTRHQDLTLSLDTGVQSAVHEALSASRQRFQAIAAAAVVMDVHTAEILALVSLPDYDPKESGYVNKDAQFNRATLGLYEMGSTFKLFTAAMALDQGLIALDSVYDARTPLTVARYTINDYHAEKRWLTIPEILIHSSNIGAAKIALDAGTSEQQAFLQKIGMLSPLDLELPEVGTPIYPNVWRKINTVTISYGHGIAVTPVHVASAVGAMVNGGRLVRPTLLRRDTVHPDDSSRVISETTSEQMRWLMRLIVTEGSGKRADIPGYVIGGKTGSAELAKAGGYSQEEIRTSFVAAFPLHQPRYVVLVLLDEPQGLKETNNYRTAGWNAAPTVRRIIAEIAPILGVYPTTDQSLEPALGELMKASARISDMALAPAGNGFWGDRAAE